MRRRHRLVRALALLGAVGFLAAVQAQPWAAARPALALPVVLFAPGLGVLNALRVELGSALLRLALAFMLSLGISSLAALTLSASGESLTEDSSVAVLCAVLCSLAGVELVRAIRSSHESALAQPLRASVPAMSREGVAAALWVAFVAVCVAEFHSLLPGSRPQDFVQLRLAGPWADVSSVVAVDPRRRVSIPLAVENHSRSVDSFRLRTVTSTGGRWPDVEVHVPPGTTWRGSVRGQVPTNGCATPVSISLLRTRPAQPAAALRVWFTSATEASCSS